MIEGSLHLRHARLARVIVLFLTIVVGMVAYVASVRTAPSNSEGGYPSSKTELQNEIGGWLREWERIWHGKKELPTREPKGRVIFRTNSQPCRLSHEV